jgi:hypothetical protein
MKVKAKATEKEIIKEYSPTDRKKLVEKVEKLKKREHYVNVFKLITQDTDKYTVNSNGVWIVINALPDSTMQKIENYIHKIKRTEKKTKKLFIKSASRTSTSSSSDNTTKSDIATQETETFSNFGPKLSNRDKNIIKRYRYNREKGDDVLYRDFDPKLLSTENQEA